MIVYTCMDKRHTLEKVSNIVYLFTALSLAIRIRGEMQLLVCRSCTPLREPTIHSERYREKIKVNIDAHYPFVV